MLRGALARLKSRQAPADGTSSHPSRADDESKSRYEKQEPDYDPDKLKDKDDQRKKGSPEEIQGGEPKENKYDSYRHSGPHGCRSPNQLFRDLSKCPALGH